MGWGDPWGVAMDQVDTIFICDNYNKRVCIVSPLGQHIWNINLGRLKPRSVVETSTGQLMITCETGVVKFYQYWPFSKEFSLTPDLGPWCCFQTQHYNFYFVDIMTDLLIGQALLTAEMCPCCSADNRQYRDLSLKHRLAGKNHCKLNRSQKCWICMKYNQLLWIPLDH